MDKTALTQVLEVIDGEIASLPAIATVIRLGGNNCDVQPAIDRLVRIKEFVETELKTHGEPVEYQARRQNTLTGEWGEWTKVSHKDHDEIAADLNPNHILKYEARKLYTAPLAPEHEGCKPSHQITENDVRRIVREELARAARPLE